MRAMFYINDVIASELAVKSFFSHLMGNQKTAVSRIQLIFSILLIWQKKFLFDHRIDIHDEPAWSGPARPDPALALFDRLLLIKFIINELEILT